MQRQNHRLFSHCSVRTGFCCDLRVGASSRIFYSHAPSAQGGGVQVEALLRPRLPDTDRPAFAFKTFPADFCHGLELLQGRVERDGRSHRGHQRNRRCARAAVGAGECLLVAAGPSGPPGPAALATHTEGAGTEAGRERDDPRPASGPQRGRRRPRVLSDFQVCLCSYCVSRFSLSS